MLYPESTGIKPAQSMKRNVTADSMNITTVAVDTDDDELYDDDLKNMTNSTDIKKGKIECSGFLVICLSLKSKNRRDSYIFYYIRYIFNSCGYDFFIYVYHVLDN